MISTVSQILLLPLAQKKMFDSLYDALSSDISAQFSSIRKNTVDDAYTYLSATKPSAVLVVDVGLTSKRNTHLQQSLARYASQITRVSPCLLSVTVVTMVIMAASYPIILPEAWEYLLRKANRTLIHLVISTTSIDIWNWVYWHITWSREVYVNVRVAYIYINKCIWCNESEF